MNAVGGSIVVGVTGAGRETAALRYAAELARREGAEVVLAHAYPVDVIAPPPPGSFTTNDWLREVAEQITEKVVEEFGSLAHASVRCRTEIRPGHPASVLTELSRDARCVVVQNQGRTTLGRIFVGSTANHLAVTAHCPLVSVPLDWTPPESPGRVLVGVHGEGGPQEALEAGLAEARAVGARVRVLHGWHLDPVYDDIITARVTQEWGANRERAAAQKLEALAASYPDVDVAVRVVHQSPAQALIEQAGPADLVVVGRHAKSRWLPGRLGSVARTVLREAKAPVMVVPVGTADHRAADPDVAPSS